MRARPLVLGLVLCLASCTAARRASAPLGPLEAAARATAPDARQEALAGFHALLVGGDAEKAKARFERAVAKDRGEPWALWGLSLLALRASHPERAIEASLDLLERSPPHPLQAVAARSVFGFTGLSVRTDDLVLARADAVLAHAQGEGAALFRALLSGILLGRDRLDDHAKVLADLGAPTVFSLAGPFSPLHLLDLDQELPPERTGEVGELPDGPYGKLAWREVPFPDGRFALAGEPKDGDVYLLAVDFDLPRRQELVVRAVSSMELVGRLDGQELFVRRDWARPASTVTAARVTLDAGAHRLLLKVARDQLAGAISVSVTRPDGRPAGLVYRPARGPAPRWGGVPAEPGERAALSTAHAVFEALADEAGPALAAYAAAWDSDQRDGDGARRLFAEWLDGLQSPAVRVLRADLALADRAIGARVARGRAVHDYEAALEKDPKWTAALAALAELASDDSRHADALDLLARARATRVPAGAPLLALQARVELAMGVDAHADQSARAADAALPGHCDALSLRYDLARRRDAVADADALLAASATCPGALSRRAEHLKLRGDLEGAAKAFEALLARDLGQVAISTSLANAWASLRRFDAAAALLERQRALWPRDASLLTTLADVRELQGDPAGALAAREAALLVDGGNLALRRTVERARTGRELLQEYAITTKEAVDAYDAAPGSEDVTSAYLLDAAAVRVYPDGSMVDRIHIIQKAMDQSGVSEVAEVDIPQGAELLALRTLKADGTVLEPESVEGKDSISLPGVQVGDLVEYEYLQAHPPRVRSMPGFTASAFYFQVARQPNNWSTYVVAAPKGLGLEVDPHHMQVPKVKEENGLEVFRHEERRVPPYLPEPNAPVAPTEWLPYVVVGAGQQGNDGLVVTYADGFLSRGQVSWEVERFARRAAAGKAGLDAVRAVYEAVMEKLSGRDQGLQVSAAASVVADRGSRLWLLYASLRALDLGVRLAAVRTAAADPAPPRFPSEAQLPYVALRVTLPSGDHVWLDPVIRFAPFGELPEAAQGREAFVLPEPGRPLEKTRTPKAALRPTKTVSLRLRLGLDGVLAGEGEETYLGFEAAQLAEALESLDAEQRQQALQGALSRYFGGAELSKLELEVRRQVGAPLTLRYAFKAPRFARRDGESALVLGAVAYPAWLGRRFLSLSERRTPLYLESTELTTTQVTLDLPPGWALASPLGQARAECPWGRFVRKERQEGDRLFIEEEYRLDAGRIPPAEYARFAQFAGEVDLLQGRDLVVAKR